MTWVVGNLAVLEEVLKATPWAKAYLIEAKCTLVAQNCGDDPQMNRE